MWFQFFKKLTFCTLLRSICFFKKKNLLDFSLPVKEVSDGKLITLKKGFGDRSKH